MSSMNKVFLVGRLKAETTTTSEEGKSAFTKFQLITSNKWRDKSNVLCEQIETHNILATSKKSKICKTHLTKGDRVFIEGENQTDKDGKTEILVKSIILLSYSKKNRTEEPNEESDIDD